jgi:phage terminase small subunit
LNDKHKKFCQEFVSTFNATQSYLKVYECDYNTAKSNGNKLLTITHIKREIERLKREKAKSILVKPDDILEKRMRIAFSDMKQFVEWGNEDKRNYVSFKDSKNVDGDLVSEVKKGKDGASIKIEDRQKALDWLANYFLMNPLDKHKVKYDELNYEHKVKMDNKRFEQDKQVHADKMAMEEKKINNDTGLKPVVIVDNIAAYLEEQEKNKTDG